MSSILDHFTKLDGDPKIHITKCNYCGKNYACHVIFNGTKPKKEKDESGDQSYNYDEYNTLSKMAIIDELSFNFVEILNHMNEIIGQVIENCLLEWRNSTYLMLEAAEKFANVFEKSEPRYMSYFLEVDLKENKKKHGATYLGGLKMVDLW
uniref:Uncharacterized protein n=1 Tax=Salix viminalis TaxID=40686 RepID=A0A6N2KA88_SALVM